MLTLCYSEAPWAVKQRALRAFLPLYEQVMVCMMDGRTENSDRLCEAIT